MAFDAIIIGSGFGGSVTACRLAEDGRRVLVLERGKRWNKDNYPRQATDQWLWDQNHPEKSPGWLDLRRFPHMTVAQGAAVGGGSHIRPRRPRASSNRAGRPRSAIRISSRTTTASRR